jgi:hypothetical protein
MRKTRIFEGQYTCLHEINETDAYFDVMSVLQRGITFEIGERYENDIDFITNPRSGVLAVVVRGNETVFIARMVHCEKISCESLIDKERILSEYDINSSEWENVLASDKKLHIYEPMKRVFKFRIELTMPEPDLKECQEFFEAAMELLQNIQ